MRISAAELSRYRSRLSDAASLAEGYVRARVLDECAGLRTSEARDLAIEIVEDAVSTFGDQARAAACDFFDEVAEAEGAGARSSMADGLTDHGDVEGKVRYYARSIAYGRGDLPRFADDCASRAGFYVWREGNVCMASNCGG